jgi:hypothetical protein
MKICDKLMGLVIIASMVLCAVVLLMFVFDPNVNAEYIHEMELENNR